MSNSNATKVIENCKDEVRELCNDITFTQNNLNNAKTILSYWEGEYGGRNISIQALDTVDSEGHTESLMWVANYEEIERFVSIAQDYVVSTYKKLEELEVRVNKIFKIFKEFHTQQ